MVTGVRLNGRNYAQGDTCVYLPRIQPRGNRDGVGGRDGASKSHLIGLINMFYILPQGDVTFVSIRHLPTVPKVRTLYVTPTVNRPVQAGLAYEYQQDTDVLIHVDSITAKLFLVPHFDSDRRVDFMCGITMWDSR